MTPPEAPTRAYIRRRQSGLPWTLTILTVLAFLSTTDSQAQEWRFDAIDQRFVEQQRTAERRFNQLDQRLDKELWDHRLSHQDLWRTQGIVNILRDIVRGLQKEVAYLRQLIEPSQPSRPPLADIRKLLPL
jgi:uncharacterized membrane protein YccC